MDLAPVEYVVIGYDGDAVDAGVVPPLRKLVEAGTIRILDLVLIRKHGDARRTEIIYHAALCPVCVAAVDDRPHHHFGHRGRTGPVLAYGQYDRHAHRRQSDRCGRP